MSQATWKARLTANLAALHLTDRVFSFVMMVPLTLLVVFGCEVREVAPKVWGLVWGTLVLAQLAHDERI